MMSLARTSGAAATSGGGDLIMSGETEDPFLRTFFARIPEDVAKSFSRPQLDAIKRAFGARTPGSHAVDLRFSLPLGWRWFYFVLLIGPERRCFGRRELERLFRPLWTVANALIIAVFLLMFMVGGLSVLYVGKRALGIDVFPGIDMLPDRTIERLLHR
jgi:hypothetical protein